MLVLPDVSNIRRDAVVGSHRKVECGAVWCNVEDGSSRTFHQAAAKIFAGDFVRAY